MSDNPFAEPEDDNRTVIRPTPGRRRAAAPEQPTVARSDQPPPEAPAAIERSPARSPDDAPEPIATEPLARPPEPPLSRPTEPLAKPLADDAPDGLVAVGQAQPPLYGLRRRSSAPS